MEDTILQSDRHHRTGPLPHPATHEHTIPWVAGWGSGPVRREHAKHRHVAPDAPPTPVLQ